MHIAFQTTQFHLLSYNPVPVRGRVQLPFWACMLRLHELLLLAMKNHACLRLLAFLSFAFTSE
jgi:hypothetical protein